MMGTYSSKVFTLDIRARLSLVITPSIYYRSLFLSLSSPGFVYRRRGVALGHSAAA